MARISKAQARKLYDNGGTITIVPCNLRPGAWGVDINNADGRTFDAVVNEFAYYNCGYAETGRRPAFYID